MVVGICLCFTIPYDKHKCNVHSESVATILTHHLSLSTNSEADIPMTEIALSSNFFCHFMDNMVSSVPIQNI